MELDIMDKNKEKDIEEDMNINSQECIFQDLNQE